MRLEGRAVAEAKRAEIVSRVESLRGQGIMPKLAVLLATQDESALAYFRAKERLAGKLGIAIEAIQLPDATTAQMVEQVRTLADDPSVSGIMIETPLPASVDPEALRTVLPAEKDVDGAGLESMGRLLAGDPVFAPATAAAVMELLDGHGIDPAGKRVVIIGRSLVVGRPLALLMLQRNATVTVCHSRTVDLPAVAREGEILCVAVGRAGFVGADMVRPGAVIVDVGTNVVDGKLVGDVDFDEASAAAERISPVPGGVGPLTTTLLMEHVVLAAEWAAGAR